MNRFDSFFNYSDADFKIALDQGFTYKYLFDRPNQVLILHKNTNNQILAYYCKPDVEEPEELIVIKCLLFKEEMFKGVGVSKSSQDQAITKATTLEEMQEQLNNGLSPRIIMRKSCMIGRVDLVHYLIENNLFQINDVCDTHNCYSILHIACYNFSSNIVKYALSKGIDTNMKDARDCITAHTDLVWRILKQLIHKSTNQEQVITMLSENGIPSNLKSNSQVGDVDVNLLEKVLRETKGLTLSTLIRIGYELDMLRMLRKAMWNIDTPVSEISVIFQ